MMSALMQRLLPEEETPTGALMTGALMAQLRRREIEREKAAFAAAGGTRTAAMKTDEDAPRSRMLTRQGSPRTQAPRGFVGVWPQPLGSQAQVKVQLE